MGDFFDWMADNPPPSIFFRIFRCDDCELQFEWDGRDVGLWYQAACPGCASSRTTPIE